MPRVRVSPLGPKVQNLLTQVLDFSVCIGARLEQSNATQMSVAAASSMAANFYLRLPAQMQTSLATRTKKAEMA